MTFRTFTLKDFFDPEEAARSMRLARRNPFPHGDLAAAGLTFVDLPPPSSFGSNTLENPASSEEREVIPEHHRHAEQLALAKDWVERRD